MLVGKALPGLLFLPLFGVVANLKHRNSQSAAQTQVEFSSKPLSDEVSRRLRQAVYGLNVARGVFAASESVNRAVFRACVESRWEPVVAQCFVVILRM